LDLGKFGIGKDEGDPKEEVCSDRKAKFFEAFPNGEGINGFFDGIGFVKVGAAEVFVVLFEQ